MFGKTKQKFINTDTNIQYMKKIQINIDWTVVFWISITTLFLWLLAKAVGLIQTPWFIEAIPYVVSFMAFVAGVKRIAEFGFKVDNLIVDVKELNNRTTNIESGVHQIDKRLAVVESKL